MHVLYRQRADFLKCRTEIKGNDVVELGGIEGRDSLTRISETKRVLQLCGHFAVLWAESVTALWILNPSLVKHKE